MLRIYIDDNWNLVILIAPHASLNFCLYQSGKAEKTTRLFWLILPQQNFTRPYHHSTPTRPPLQSQKSIVRGFSWNSRPSWVKTSRFTFGGPWILPFWHRNTINETRFADQAPIFGTLRISARHYCYCPMRLGCIFPKSPHERLCLHDLAEDWGSSAVGTAGQNRLRYWCFCVKRPKFTDH